MRGPSGAHDLESFWCEKDLSTRFPARLKVNRLLERHILYLLRLEKSQADDLS